MHLSGITLPLVLALALPACAANAGAGASAGGAEARAEAGVALQNRAEALRLMQQSYPLLLRDARVTGEVYVQLTLDAAGAVTASDVTRTTQDYFTDAALRVAPQLRFSAPGAAGARVTVRMQFAEPGEAQIAVVSR